MRDVKRVQVEVLECSKHKDNLDGGKVNSRSKDFKVIKSRMLVVALGHQSSLVVCSSQNLLEVHKVLLSCSDKVQTRVQCE